MTANDLLYAIAPYAASAGLGLVFVVRCVFAALAGGMIVDRSARPLLGVRLVHAAGIIGLLTLHAVLLVTPAAVLWWNRRIPRLLLLEAAGLCVGVVCLWAVLRAIRRHMLAAATPCPRPLIELVSLTLVGLAVSSGVALAVGYRWASWWSVVTLTPYAASIVRLEPRIELVVATPFLVRLHVFSTFALAPLLPFTLAGSRTVGLAARGVLGAARSAAAALAPLVSACAERARRVLRPETTWGEEEN